ncbi:MAG: phosphomannomutase/phosphoglucomutase [Gemmatimonadetes bacterium]|nr:MAG: phosphomannomutase/phosphoglucomutase [Gemmatimonadota bacterium]
MRSMTPPAHIFRQYDIRGLVGRELTPEVARAVGVAYGARAVETLGRAPTVVVGHDNRPSSPDLQAGLIAGLVEAGAKVVDIGLVPTPVAYWAEKTLGTDGAVQITGSHNPPEWNGIKMTLAGGSVYGDAIQDLRTRIESGASGPGGGELRTESVLDRYVDDIAGRFSLARPVKVVVDCGNGTGSVVAERLLRALGAEVVPLYCESDGTFPNHHPDPTVDEYLADLIRTVREEGADVGIGFDGDADRIGAVDEQGTIVRGDILLLLFGLDILARRGPGQKLIFDVKCSQVLPDEFAKAGGVPIMWKTGHSLMKEKMREEGAPLAGELSGHICFADTYLGFDDAPYDACRLIDLIARSERPLSAMVADFPRYVSTPELRIDVTEEEKFRVVEAAQRHFREHYDVIDVDGARILFGDGWALLRASNTQPVIVARYEARSEERLAEIRGEVEAWLRTQGVDV